MVGGREDPTEGHVTLSSVAVVSPAWRQFVTVAMPDSLAMPCTLREQQEHHPPPPRGDHRRWPACWSLPPLPSAILNRHHRSRSPPLHGGESHGLRLLAWLSEHRVHKSFSFCVRFVRRQTVGSYSSPGCSGSRYDQLLLDRSVVSHEGIGSR